MIIRNVTIICPIGRIKLPRTNMSNRAFCPYEVYEERKEKDYIVLDTI